MLKSFLLGNTLLALSVISNGDQVAKFEPYSEAIKDGVSEIQFQPIQGGSLELNNGSSTTISDFWMATLEVTWDQYDAFVYETEFSTNYSKQELQKLGIDGVSGATSPYTDMSFGMGRGNHPATNMTQYGALMFCKWLSAKTGKFYRLPTEAEWTYACKTGSQGLDLATLIRSDANANGYAESGSFAADQNGVYDLIGNISEWTMDKYVSEPQSEWSNQSNPWLEPTDLYPRVLRGGSWKDELSKCNCDRRLASKANWKKQDPQIPKSLWWHTNAPFVGFRVVRPREVPTENEIRKFWLNPVEDYN